MYRNNPSPKSRRIRIPNTEQASQETYPTKSNTTQQPSSILLDITVPFIRIDSLNHCR
jgi:hypothetical protein